MMVLMELVLVVTICLGDLELWLLKQLKEVVVDVIDL